MSALFDRFLKDPSAASCGCGEGCCGDQAPSDERKTGTEDESRPERASGKRPWIIGRTATPSGDVPVVSTRLTRADRLGTWKARWGVGRLHYAVPPGLYGVGRPEATSMAFVTANYKMSFDRLRAALAERDAWILVLDTRGINVWCAAGKGTFGTDELVRRIEDSGLARIVSHRTLVLPQLGAPGVAAHDVAKRARFRVVYGPARATDLPAFLDAGLKATPDMRKVRFSLSDRLVLTPIEIVGAVTHWAFLAVLGLWLLRRIGIAVPSVDAPAVLGAILVGAVAVPALLPWIPGRAFALKGGILGLIWAAAVCLSNGWHPATVAGWAAGLSYLLILPALSAFIAMNFTGSTPITSLSGVIKEMRTAVPLMIIAAVLGVAAMVVAAVVRT